MEVTTKGSDGTTDSQGSTASAAIPDLALAEVDNDAAVRIRSSFAEVSERVRPSAKERRSWLVLGGSLSAILALAVVCAAYRDIYDNLHQDWGGLIVMAMPFALVVFGLFLGGVMVDLYSDKALIRRFDPGRISASLLRLGGLPQMSTGEELLKAPIFLFLYLPAFICMPILLGLGFFRLATQGPLHSSQQSVSTVLSLILTLLLAGALAGAVGHLAVAGAYRRWLIDRVCWGDFIIWSLWDAALIVGAVDCSGPLSASAIRPAREALLRAARRIEADPVSVAAVGLWDVSSRRQARRDHLRIGALVRSYAQKLLYVHGASDFARIRDAVISDFAVACSGAWNEILESAPESDSRTRRLKLSVKAARVAAPVVVAVVAPLIPGFAEAANFRLPLLLMSVLAVLSGPGGAGEVVKDAAGKGLWDSLAGHK